MIGSDEQAKNIIIRELTKKDNQMLRKIKEIFSTRWNNVAVMKASYGYLEKELEVERLKKEKKLMEVKNIKLADEITGLKNRIKELDRSKLIVDFRALRTKLREFLSYQDKTEKQGKEIKGELQNLLTGRRANGSGRRGDKRMYPAIDLIPSDETIN